MSSSRATRSSFGATAVAVVLLALAGACGGSEPRTAVQLVLTPDEDSGGGLQLLRRLQRLEVIVDAPGGLRGVTAPGPLPSGGTALDWDGDGELEARFEGQVTEDGDALPVLEIGLEANADRELTFRVMGYPPDGELAVGQGRVSARVPQGEVRRVGTPFNLTPWARPPRVLLFLPADGSEVPANVSALTAVLSTRVLAESVAPNVQVTGPDRQPIEVTTALQDMVVDSGAYGQEQRALLSIAVDLPPLPGELRVQIGPGLVSEAGQRFDQDPRTEQEEPFVSRFRLEGDGGVGGGPGGGNPQPCEDCPAGWGCVEGVSGCVPLLSCDQVGCLDGFVCDDQQGQCVADCRPLGQCLGPGECDPQTGLCR